jgi:hypothetical protein
MGKTDREAGFVCRLWKGPRMCVRVLLTGYLSACPDSDQLVTDPYPWAIDEGFDIYRTLTETKGGIIGMNGQKLDIIMCGDSA